eukprot:scaffold3738_cov129-Pinguiococcus_pyrenoidosus.AAC.1
MCDWRQLFSGDGIVRVRLDGKWRRGRLPSDTSEACKMSKDSMALYIEELAEARDVGRDEWCPHFAIGESATVLAADVESFAYAEESPTYQRCVVRGDLDEDGSYEVEMEETSTRER